MTEQKKIGKVVDVVSQDRNWVYRINGELGSEKKWDSQWGYLSGGFSPDKTNIKPSVKDKIQQLQQELKQMDKKEIYQTTSKDYGFGNKVQMFQNNKNNIIENKDLRAMERRLPKNWKKGKWTAPVDPFDPLSKKKN